MQDDGSSVLDKFRQGDAHAFETLFRMHQRSVFGWVLRIVRDPGAAEEVTVEAFWRMHRAHARFDSARGFEPWARRIATHAALDWLRQAKTENAIELLSVPARVASAVAGTRLSTETRVRCSEDASRRRFRLYWAVIAPFSGLIRREVLRTIRHEAEGVHAAK